MTSTPQDLRWPADRFYWTVLDAPGVRATNGVPEGVLSMLQEDLPVPAEDVHVVGSAVAGGRLVVCAARREDLREVPAGVLRLSPDDIPAFIEPKIDPVALNLLVGDFEPTPLRKERLSRRTIMTATAATLACVLALGLVRRAEAWNRAGVEAADVAAAVRTTIAPTGGPMAIQFELDRLRKAPHTEAKSPTAPDAAAALASLLSIWPKELECQTESVVVGPATMTLSVTVTKDARPFLSAIRPPDSWTLEEPRLTATSDGSRIHLVLHRKEARP